MKVAVLVDAAFFIRRYNAVVPDGKRHPGDVVADALHAIACQHLGYDNGARTLRITAELYRVFVYDCPPFEGKLHHPISKQLIDFSKTPAALFRHAFHRRLKQKRKVALRLGHLSEVRHWTLKADVMQDLLKGKRDLASLTETDLLLDIKQKGVNMRVGVDVASLAYKKQVDRIVLLAGDADFVPAAKLARREGVDFILDPMHAKIGADLYEHIDGLVSMTPRPGRQDDAQNPHKDFTFNAEWSSKGFSLSGSGHLPWTTADPGRGQFSLFRSQPGTPRSGQAAEDGSTEPEPAG